ncbi:MAG: BamA/TamA family outer membrane protein, partial [Xenococcaceae cyanobacterium MO_188.B19]|nr:BamA/TamA family outer membrane protein [Xenococcaceae cyanobacterium MO_188.B19]
LTFSDDGQDGLLTVTFATALDRRNETLNPTKGYRLLLQTDQSIPVGDASISYNRLSGNYTHFFPLDLFKFTKGQPTFLVNFQAGTIIGDLPGYEAFSLGGSSSVRGYSKGELGTARSFLQATAEYRFPMFSFNMFKKDFDIGGAIFFDYGTDLGSGDTVKGEPATFRDKPNDGFGYGLGLRSISPIGLFKIEFALNDQGDSKVIFRFGDRF